MLNEQSNGTLKKPSIWCCHEVGPDYFTCSINIADRRRATYDKFSERCVTLIEKLQSNFCRVYFEKCK